MRAAMTRKAIRRAAFVRSVASLAKRVLFGGKPNLPTARIRQQQPTDDAGIDAQPRFTGNVQSAGRAVIAGAKAGE